MCMILLKHVVVKNGIKVNLIKIIIISRIVDYAVLFSSVLHGIVNKNDDIENEADAFYKIFQRS